MPLSTRGRGAHGPPFGVTTSFRPPRFLNVIGTWTVIVSPSIATVARFTLPPSWCPHALHQTGQAVAEPNVDAVLSHIDSLDQQLDGPRALGKSRCRGRTVRVRVPTAQLPRHSRPVASALRPVPLQPARAEHLQRRVEAGECLGVAVIRLVVAVRHRLEYQPRFSCVIAQSSGCAERTCTSSAAR